MVLVTHKRIWKKFFGARPWRLKPVYGSTELRTLVWLQRAGEQSFEKYLRIPQTFFFVLICSLKCVNFTILEMQQFCINCPTPSIWRTLAGAGHVVAFTSCPSVHLWGCPLVCPRHLEMTDLGLDTLWETFWDTFEILFGYFLDTFWKLLGYLRDNFGIL